MAEIVGVDFTRPIIPLAELGNTAAVYVKTDDGKPLARKGNRNGKPNITQSNNSNLSGM